MSDEGRLGTFSREDVKLLRDVASRWRELSENPEATECRTDHCHSELEELEEIAWIMEVKINAAKLFKKQWRERFASDERLGKYRCITCLREL